MNETWVASTFNANCYTCPHAGKDLKAEVKKIN
jgi:hypothetical protein